MGVQRGKASAGNKGLVNAYDKKVDQVVVPGPHLLPAVAPGRGQPYPECAGARDRSRTPSAGTLADVHRSPRDLLDMAFAHEASFAPGTSWEYSNTNYVLAGLLVEKITGRPLSDELNDRIIKPIGLRHTYSPAKGETIRGRHPRAYGSVKPGGPLVDITDQELSRSWRRRPPMPRHNT
ncbi:serine hydrolase domain-containing protein [Nonomuraea sp. NPDC046802]|uniref:serine hydrolase domain-containing protein n=1 Tax=Nonomuraea sp. NPDC046802 TaxID=3154919 RepID=UPI0033D68397